MAMRSALLILIAVVCVATQSAFCQTPAGTQVVRVKMGIPRKNGINPYFMSLGWRVDGGLEREASGIAYLNGPDHAAPDDAITAARKIVTAAREALLQVKPSERGAVIDQAMNGAAALPEVIYQNKAGFTLTKIVERDDSNQTEKTHLSDKPFAAAQIELAIDVVDADLFNLSAKPQSSVLKLWVEGGATVQIQTPQLAPSEIEDQIAEALNASQIDASVEGSPRALDTAAEQRPIGMRFDGSEVHIPGLQARVLTVDMNDPTLSLITRLTFGSQEGMSLTRAFVGISSMVLGVVGFFIVRKRREIRRRRTAK
ncbi:MAG: hypothetical protein ACRED0_05330 [Gammaproteobacteria bacterium]